MLVVQLVDD
ncbi:hypothetical protein Zm00014a_015450 [Zea mays]|uniref:Uncharacterized protein n=1 Tax=Zea mays TaxID=4577 RepID=A0A3L6G3W4_MAIZE|nr:hypothetical protein Zm00014a_015450 [Zea mays]